MPRYTTAAIAPPPPFSAVFMLIDKNRGAFAHVRITRASCDANKLVLILLIDFRGGA